MPKNAILSDRVISDLLCNAKGPCTCSALRTGDATKFWRNGGVPAG